MGKGKMALAPRLGLLRTAGAAGRRATTARSHHRRPGVKRCGWRREAALFRAKRAAAAPKGRGRAPAASEIVVKVGARRLKQFTAGRPLGVRNGGGQSVSANRRKSAADRRDRRNPSSPSPR